MSKQFPKDFVWGVATASYQIEGAAREGGRGESIWDRYCAIPGNVQDGDTGDVACDHYHLFREDVELMRRMGVKAYRFSIAWPRVLPQGRGEVNEKGLAFYSELVDALLEAGIEPYVTLYHWDLPQALQDIGGWANHEMPEIFLAYAKLIFERLGGRVKHFITLNEPYCAAFLGHYEGRMAPGLHDFSTAVRAAYHMYVGHGMVVKAFRESGLAGEIGIALNLMGRLPLTDKPEDIEAARRADGYLNRWFIEPIMLGRYPQDMVELYQKAGVVLPAFKPEDLALMHQKLDFVGLNYYNDFWVKDAPERWPVRFVIENPKNMPVTDRNWPITESGFADMLLRMKNEYGVEKIIVTENGASYPDVVSLSGEVEDGARCDYLHRHLLAMYEAMEKGAPVEGYFCWSLLDNFEWACGYSSRFGLVYVDYATQRRVVKRSGKLYSRVMMENAIE